MLGDPTARQDLIAAIDRFEDAHHRLLLGDPANRLPAADTKQLQVLYYEGEQPLDKMVAAYVSQARTIADMNFSDQAIRAKGDTLFALARQPLLSQLDDVVAEHERTSNRQLARLRSIQNVMLLIVLSTLLIEALAIFRPMVRRITSYARELMRLATTDPLTGALNRRSFLDRADAEIDRAKRYSRALSVMMIDADHFKRVNDTYGHGGGDAVLKRLVSAISESLRASDILGRLGGEEFAILLPDTAHDVATSLAERLCAKIAALETNHRDSIIRFTVSIGVAPVDPTLGSLQPSLDLADLALYEAKSQGRNRVVTRFHDLGDRISANADFSISGQPEMDGSV
jgi:diguanylate cyclase (GGDEF)-like protein